MKQADIIIIGAGMAGCSAAATLAGSARVIVLEQEPQPGYHATGRSAATLAPFYGPKVIQQLTALSAPYLNAPPASVSDTPFTSPRGEMILVGHSSLVEDQADSAATEALVEESLAHGLQTLSFDEAQQMVEQLKPDAIDRVLYTDKLLSIDVDALHQSYIRQLCRAGGEIICSSPVTRLDYTNTHWHVTCNKTVYQAPVIVNAAGAWADEVATLAGLPHTGLQPKRRSAALIPFPELPAARPQTQAQTRVQTRVQTRAQSHPHPPDSDQLNPVANWPMVLDIHERFYCIPFGSGLMVSPADETPMDAHDVWPEDIDLATGIDHFQELLDYDVQTMTHSWAGLRTFAADGEPIVGFDPLAEGFFWLAGQGGYGIQTAPAISMLCDYLINNNAGEHADSLAGFKEQLSPARLRRHL